MFVLNNPSGSSKSLWMEFTLSSFPTLQNNLHADVCIVGAGITGLTCAYTLAKEGKSVIVLEQGTIGGGQTARTTAHLTWALDDRYFELEKYFGKKGSQLAAKSHNAAIDYIEQIIKTEKIDCDFERVDGYLFVPPEDSVDILDKEFKAIQKTGMLVHRLPTAPCFDTGPCLHFPQQAQFHILKYLEGLSQSILQLGGKIFTHTFVKDVKDGLLCKVETESKNHVTAKSVIIATCTPVNNRFFIHTKQAAYRTYVIAASIPKRSIPKGLYWDTSDPYHYVRTHQDEWLIVGGEDHKTGQSLDCQSQYDLLEAWTRVRFPMIKEIGYRWSGQIFEPIDSLAFIGKNFGDDNIYIATGDSGNGMTHGTIAGILIPDLILGRKNPLEKLYQPKRKTLSAIPEFIHENINSFAQLKDWFTPGELKKIEELELGEGQILRKGLKKLAVYKNENGQITIRSAVCPHLGGCLRWNSCEKSWDCPLHGSRFDPCGHVITGPAGKDLT